MLTHTAGIHHVSFLPFQLMPTGLEFLLATKPTDPGLVCAVFGDEEFLKREVLAKLKGSSDSESFAGRDAQWPDVHDALTTTSLFDDAASMVTVEEADTFVTRYRDKLETWATDARCDRLLVLELKTWTKTTRLAKAMDKKGLAIDCRLPTKGRERTAFARDARKWIALRAKKIHQTEIDGAALERMFDLLPMSLGIIDQEVAKLGLMSGDDSINLALVQEQVGDLRTRQTWDMIDAMVEGRAAEAIKQLDKLLAAGEQPIGLHAQVASTLRRFATASQLVKLAEKSQRRPSLHSILEQAGFMKFKINESMSQLKQIGRPRAEKIADWLLESDLAMKGHNSSPERQRRELETLIVRLSREADPRRAAS